MSTADNIARACTDAALADRLHKAADEPRSYSAAERRALMHEAARRLEAAVETRWLEAVETSREWRIVVTHRGGSFDYPCPSEAEALERAELEQLDHPGNAVRVERRDVRPWRAV